MEKAKIILLLTLYASKVSKARYHDSWKELSRKH